uniref:Hyp25 n=1 Tax=Moniliophthora roreri (strain MCA 2997) TaxID=1381753 RepID=F2WVM5_MONRO|nr:hyp25 [Moniliophthora roreri]ADO51608.1 hyp25 [Moniliophthora roreri]
MTIKIFINLYLISIFIIFHNIINKNYTCAAPTITILIKIILLFQMSGMFSFPNLFRLMELLQNIIM